MADSKDLRLIEDYLPIQAISAEASREKSVRKGHISTLHLWWARRPLVACRAAVYGALVPADRWVKDLDVKAPVADSTKAANHRNGAKRGLNRKAAKNFVTKLCRYPKRDPDKPDDVRVKRETEAAIVEAQRHILEAHAERLTTELEEAARTATPPAWVEEFKFRGERVSHDDIIAGNAPRPRVLDMFAGGGAIPLEALRLGCEALALDLNPVAHIIELCTLVYPQKYGKPDPAAPGMTGPKNAKGERTWGGLAPEVRHWGQWVLERARREIADLYPPIPNPTVWQLPPEIAFDKEVGRWIVTKAGRLKPGVRKEDLHGPQVRSLLADDDRASDDRGDEASIVPVPAGFLSPVAYLWTRTVRCKNPGCRAAVPLVRQTWMRKRAGDFAALQMIADTKAHSIRFTVGTARTAKGLGFDPTGFSSGGNATCPFCGSVSDIDYVKDEGWNGRIGAQLMAAACVSPRDARSKVYVSPDECKGWRPDDSLLRRRIKTLCEKHGLTVPDEQIASLAADDRDNTLGITVRPYGIRTFGDLFNARQLAAMLAFAGQIRRSENAMDVYEPDARIAVMSLLACFLDRLADFSSTACVWNSLEGERTAHTFGRHAISMTWDYAEADPFNPANAGWPTAISRIVPAIESIDFQNSGDVLRGSALSLPVPDESLDAIMPRPQNLWVRNQ